MAGPSNGGRDRVGGCNQTWPDGARVQAVSPAANSSSNQIGYRRAQQGVEEQTEPATQHSRLTSGRIGRGGAPSAGDRADTTAAYLSPTTPHPSPPLSSGITAPRSRSAEPGSFAALPSEVHAAVFRDRRIAKFRAEISRFNDSPQNNHHTNSVSSSSANPSDYRCVLLLHRRTQAASPPSGPA